MHVAQRGDHLEFDDDPVLDQEVGGIFANDHVVTDDDSSLLDGVEVFNEPTTERIANPESTTNDPLSHRLQQPRIPFIHLHPAHPS
jgi:hypothetical protein